MYYKRAIEANVKKSLFKGQIIVIYGSRRVGKTTFVKKIIEENSDLSPIYLNCDEPDIVRGFRESKNSSELRNFVGNSKLVVIDEAQRIKDIGLKLKLLIDNYPDLQIIATGSSSFDLANEINEPLTGRMIEFWLYPLSIPEMSFGSNLDFSRNLESLLIYGSYPKVFESNILDIKKEVINGIAQNYLYKDVIKFQNLKNSEIVQKILEALALQIGQEVSYGEIASLVGVTKETVKSYIELLEKVFIIFRIRPFSRNLRKEIGKLRKIYFYDLGIRNSLLRNFNPIHLRGDVGALWENFVISEMKKRENYIGNLTNYYYWRTYDGSEIDLIEDSGGVLKAFELKWQKIKKNPPKAFRETYTNSTWKSINKDNYFEFLDTLKTA